MGRKACLDFNDKMPFEQFDAGDRWKLEEVDASSTLPDGAIVTGFQQLRQYLAEDRLDQVAFSVLKHLSIYAIGRSLTYNELEFLRRDAQRLKENDYRLQDMIQYVVNSPLFLEK